MKLYSCFFFSSRRRHTRSLRDWSSDVCSSDLQQAFGPECLPINLPAEGGRRVIDCWFSREGPATDFSSVEQAHRAIIEQVIEIDTNLLERYLGGDESITPE